MLAILYLKKMENLFGLNCIGQKSRAQVRNRNVCLTNFSFIQTFFCKHFIFTFKFFLKVLFMSSILFQKKLCQDECSVSMALDLPQWVWENSLFSECNLHISCLSVYIFEHVIYI